MTTKKDASGAGGPSALSGLTAGPVSSYGAAYLLRDLGQIHEAMDCLEWQARSLAERLEELKDMAFGASTHVLSDIAEGPAQHRSEAEPWPTGEEDQKKAEKRRIRGRETAREAVQADDDLEQERIKELTEGRAT